MQPNGTILAENIVLQPFGAEDVEQKTLQVSWELQDDDLGSQLTSIIAKAKFL